MDNKKKEKTTADYHEQAARPEGLTMVVLLLRKVMFLLLLVRALRLSLTLHSTALILLISPLHVFRCTDLIQPTVAL